MKIYIDGEFHERQNAKVSVFDHGLLYGDGVFEGIRVYGGKVFRLDEHMRRLYESARAILLDIPIGPSAMESAVLDAVRENALADGYVRVVVTRGEGRLGIDPSGCKAPAVIIIAADISVYPSEDYSRGIPVVTASSRRMPPDSIEPRVKSLNYLNNVLAKIEAAQAGCREAIMLNAQGYVAECTVDNVFVSKGGVLRTPPPYCGALDGITMREVLEIASRLGINCEMSPLTRYDLYTAEECFLTGTGAEVMPVVRVDGRAVGEGRPGPVTLRIMEEFRKRVSSL